MRASLALLALLALAPAASALTVELSGPAYANLGQAVTLTGRVLDESGAAVPAVRVQVVQAGSGRDLVTGPNGTFQVGVYQGREAGVRAVSAAASARMAGGHWEPAASNTAWGNVTFTQVVLKATAASSQAPPGGSIQLTVAATWLHDGQPVPGLRVRLAGDLDLVVATGADGTLSLPLTSASARTVPVVAGVEPADRPHGILADPTSPLPLQFAAASGGGDGGAGGGGAGGGGGGGGGGGTAGPSSGTSGPASPPANPDQDGDLVPDAADAFPADPLEATDLDQDGVGDRGDPVSEPQEQPARPTRRAQTSNPKNGIPGLGAVVSMTLALSMAGLLRGRLR